MRSKWSYGPGGSSIDDFGGDGEAEPKWKRLSKAQKEK